MTRERIRLEKALTEVEGQITRLEKLLASPFAEKAPAEVVQKETGEIERVSRNGGQVEAQLRGLE